MCGFSARTVAALDGARQAEFAAVDILPDPRIRQELSAISNWPTIPQLFVQAASSSAAATSSPRCTSPASWPRLLGVEPPADAPAQAARGRRSRARRRCRSTTT